MADAKRYYWIKLRTNFFSLDEIDFLLSQKNGCQYVVLYQMLCLNTANTDGKLESQLGEMIIPFDVDKIVRDCKYFDRDTVIVALELYKKLGLIFQESNGSLAISNYSEMVGSEARSTKRVREWREKKKALQCNADVIYIETQENRDKSIDIRDKSIDKEKEKRDKKHKHGAYGNVLLTDSEFESLKYEYSNYDELITYLDEYIEMKGYKAKSHYLCIKKWVVNAVNEKKNKPNNKPTERNRAF